MPRSRLGDRSFDGTNAEVKPSSSQPVPPVFLNFYVCHGISSGRRLLLLVLPRYLQKVFFVCFAHYPGGYNRRFFSGYRSRVVIPLLLITVINYCVCASP